MYRDYEDPRALEKELNEAKKKLEAATQALNNMTSCGISNNNGYTQYDALDDEVQYWHDTVSELEQRVNFAWQDEQYG